jgi:hypothetical protein
MRFCLTACGFAATLLCTLVAAQGVKPVALSPNQSIDAKLSSDAARLADDTPYACYSINTKSGEDITVTLRSRAFDGGLHVARGALCSASALQFDNDNFEPAKRDARIHFTAAGGRYLILARGVVPDAQGAYTLSIVSGAPAAAVSSVAAASASATFTATQVASQVQATEGDVKADRRALMNQQVAAHRAKLAAEEAQRQAAEAAARVAEEERKDRERQARMERDQQRDQMWGAVFNGLNQVATEYSAEQSRIADRNARYAEIEAANQRQREAEAEAARAQLRAKEAAAANDAATLKAMQQREAQQRAAAAQAANDRAAASARPSKVITTQNSTTRVVTTSTSMNTQDSRSANTSESSASRLVPTPEAIVVCTKPDSEGRFGCDSPVNANERGGPKSDLQAHRTPDLMVKSMTGSCVNARPLPSTTHLVWGCGYAATGNALYMDRSAGVDVRDRITYYCFPKEPGCRRTTP